MTREEQIKKQADIYTDDASNYTEWSDDGWSDTNDIDLVEKAFTKELNGQTTTSVYLQYGMIQALCLLIIKELYT